MRSIAQITARTALLCGVAALAAPSLVLAQDADELEEVQEQVDSDDDNFDDAEDSSTGNVIVVTALKREQTLQEAPVAVSVTTAETIERAQIRDVSDLATLVPSLRTTQEQNSFSTSYSIRGFGTSGDNIGLEPSVAMFVDGVYRSRAISQLSDLPDIQRVEVLRGPQSTLFGKNASAGVISIVTKEPAFDLGGMVEASYGNYDAMVVKGYVTGPLSDSFAASLAGGYNRRDGYITNLSNGEEINERNRWFTRGQLLFDQGGPLKVRIIGDYDKIDEECCGVVSVLQSDASQAVFAVGGQLNDPADAVDGDVIYSDVVPFNVVENWGLSGQVDYDIGDTLTLTSISAFRNTKMDANQDVDFSGARLATGATIGQSDIDTFTQEIRLTSDFDGPLNFLIGGYYFNETVDSSDQIVYGEDFREFVNLLIEPSLAAFPPNDFAVQEVEATLSALLGQDFTNDFFQPGQGFFNDLTQKNEAYSIFGTVDFEVTDALTITLGANYTHDEKDVVFRSQSTDAFSAVDLQQARDNAFAFGVSQTVGGFLGVPGGFASPDQITFFATNFPDNFALIQQGVAAEVDPLLDLRVAQFLPPFQNCPNAVEDCSTSDNDWSWTARASYEFSPTLNGYISWATGFKATSFNLSRDSRPTAADVLALQSAGLAVTNLSSGSRFAEPENSEVFEAGLKANWDFASANLTVFKQSIKNFQTNTFTGTGFIFANADEQSTFGIEFEGMARPTDALTLNLAMTYLDPKYDSFPNSPFGDQSGATIRTIPKISAVFGAQWDKEVNAAGDRLIVNAAYSYQSPVQVSQGLTSFIETDPDTGVRNYQPAFDAVRPFRREVDDLNASITYAFDMGLELTVWGRNLLDDRYLTGIFAAVAQDGAISGYANQPRTYGVAARYRF